MSWDWEKLKQQQGRGGVPPQIDEIVDRFKKAKLPGGPIILVIIAIALIVMTSVYQIEPSEVGVVQFFGRFDRTANPGLNFKLPLGIETVTKVNVTEVQTEEFGSDFSRDGSRQNLRPGADPANATLMLTGDLNVAVVPWIVQYRVKDAYNWLFKVADVRSLLRDMSEATMLIVVGDRSINEVISKRDEIAVQARDLLQKELDQAETGINIVTIEMKKTNVPAPVQPSFNEVNQAVQEKEQLIYQAREEYNTAIPAARGEAQRAIKEAEGYALDRVNRAKGDASRFTSLYGEYIKAKDVTKRRLYLETIREVIPKLGQKYIIDSGQNNVLPLLNLGNQPIINKGGEVK